MRIRDSQHRNPYKVEHTECTEQNSFYITELAFVEHLHFLNKPLCSLSIFP